jgi:hypothetical protein
MAREGAVARRFGFTLRSVALALTATAALAADRPVRVGFEADPDQAAPLLERYDEGRCPPIEGHVYLNPASPSRIEGELLILCNALREGGWGRPIALVYAHSYNRSLAETIAGRIDMPTQTVWDEELAEHAGALIATDPVVRRGEWVVGLFTTENRADVLATETPEQVRRLVGATPRGWTQDWRALSALGLKGLVDVQENGLIAPLIAEGRADFTLRLFGRSADLGHLDRRLGLRMLPIPGLKLPLDASRSFAVSRAHPEAARLAAAIDAGLARLRERGLVQAVLRDVGLLDPRVADWTAIGPAAE